MIIIGSGAGGGTLAYKLAPSGKRILLLERGPYVPREKENWDSHAVNVESRYHIKEPWFDKDGKEFHAGAHYFVGGNTKFYGAALIRLRQQDFGEVRHHGGISPAWPISYDDLEPYYTQAEHLYQVHGERGVDPTEPPRERAIPASAAQPRAAHPAARRRHDPARPPAVPDAGGHHARREESAEEQVHPLRHLRRLPVPRVREGRRAGRSASTRRCEHPNVSLITDAYVTRLETERRRAAR